MGRHKETEKTIDRWTNGKGSATVARTNWKTWQESNVLPERMVKTWPRDENGNLIGE